MGWWTKTQTKEASEIEELKDALKQYNTTIVETNKISKQTSEKSNGILQTAENALQIINRAERELQSLKKVFKNEYK